METQELTLRRFNPIAYSQEIVTVQVRAGQTVHEMLCEANGGDDLSPNLSVQIGGVEVPAKLWVMVRPKAGQFIKVYRNDLAGGSASAVLRLAAVAALTYFTFGFGAATAGAWGAGAIASSYGAWAGIGAYMLGTLAISALIPAPVASSSNTSGTSWSQLTGASNQANQWGVIPFVIGESRLYPPYAGLPYTETLGADSWLHCLFDLGYGDLQVDDADIRIGDTAVSEYDGIEYEITTGDSTLYIGDVNEDQVQTTMDDSGSTLTRTTSSGTNRITLDIVYSAGLYGVGTSGKKFQNYTKWEIVYCPTGTDNWVSPPNPDLSNFTVDGSYYAVNATNTDAFACGIGWDVDEGQYDVRVTRIENGSDTGGSKNTYVESATYTSLRSIKNTEASTTGTSKLAVRIKTSDSLNGTLDSLNLIVQQKIKVYDRATGTWSDNQINTNPAWVVYWLMTECPGVTEHAPASRIDLDSFADFADWCDSNGFSARKIQDSSQVAGEMINGILEGCLASLGDWGGKYRIVYDSGTQTPTMMFTPLETSSFKVSRSYVNIPNALRVQFKNVDYDYQDDEIIVLNDGYSYRGVDARGNASTLPEPSKFETLSIEAAMTAQQAWMVGRYHFAQAIYRANTYTFNTDISAIGVGRGDLVYVGHDVTDWGIAWGRVISVSDDAPTGYAATLTLDETASTDSTKSYSVQIRSADGSTSQTIACKPASERSNIFYLSSMPTDVEYGDAVSLGETGNDTAKLLITGIKYSEDFAAELTAVNYSDEVLAFWTNPPSSIVSEVAGQVLAPADPVISTVSSSSESDETDDAGIKTSTVRLYISDASTSIN